MQKSLTNLVTQKINQLPPDLVKQVNNFVDVLLRENKVSGSIKEYEEALKEIALHKKGKIKPCCITFTCIWLFQQPVKKWPLTLYTLRFTLHALRLTDL